MTNSQNKTDIIIVGGGIAGAAAAYWLSQAQATITLFEPATIGAHASGFAFGVLPPATYGAEYGNELNCLARKEHIRLSQVLPEQTQIDYQFRSKTHAEIALTDDRATELLNMLTDLQPTHENETAQWQDLSELRQVEPLISDRVVGALMLEGNFELEPLLFTQALWQTAIQHGATLINHKVAEIIFEGDRAIGVQLDDGTKHYSDMVILANGAWITQFVKLPVMPLRGQILRVKSNAEPLKNIYFWGKNDYVSSKPNGLDYIGSTEELLTELSPTPTEAARQKMMASAIVPFPFLGNSQLVQHTACLRPATPDKLPVVGYLKDYRNLVVVGGAGRNGILQSPLMGQMICDLLINNDQHPLLAELQPERFTQNG